MLPELGFFSLLISATAALLLTSLIPIGLWRKNQAIVNQAWGLSYLTAIFSSLSIGLLAYGFATDDFTLEYVAAHSNSQLPQFFKIAATWGGHEGSMLFWLFALSLWLAAFAFLNRQQERAFSALTQSILGAIVLAFAIFILFYSNPFGRIFPAPAEGRDLNPMLQDVGLIFHPPLLYLGYVGFAVNFAISLAGLIANRSIPFLANLMRSWVLTAWWLLTIGIVLGAWWAYYELGWGGWWFWDPVENASLMPWLLGLGLLHTTNIARHGRFSYWTTLFSLLAFAFSILGTFIVRSGALTSVHAFALDNSRGYVLLLIFFLLTVLSLGLFALRSKQQETAPFSLFSQTGAILLLNILVSIATLSTFLGTFYPMLFQAMHWGSISVGAPYFNSIFLPLISLMLIAMAISLSFTWYQADKKQLIRRLWLLAPALVLAYLLIDYFRAQDSSLPFQYFAYLLLTLAIWLFLATLWQDWRQIRFSQLAMLCAHTGVAIAAIGAIMSSYFGSEIGVRLSPTQTQQLGAFTFEYQTFSNEIGPNFTAEVAQFNVTKNHAPYAEITAERRYYDVRTMTMSEVGLDAGFWGDLYIVMGDNLGQGEFTFRLHYKPLIRWLWAGGILMAFGAFLGSIRPRRTK